MKGSYFKAYPMLCLPNPDLIYFQFLFFKSKLICLLGVLSAHACILVYILLI